MIFETREACEIEGCEIGEAFEEVMKKKGVLDQ
jgi:hypothetical protein